LPRRTGDQPHPFEARLATLPDRRLQAALSARLDQMAQHLPAQLETDLAHGVMLAEIGVLNDVEAARILTVLRDIQSRGPDGLRLDPTKSTLYWHIEAVLIDQLGEEVGGRLQTGRSHNDLLPTISRMTTRDRTLDLIEAVCRLQRAILDRATGLEATVMPGYTSLQHAQPWTFGHYLVGWSYAFDRDLDRLRHAYDHVNRSPLGAAALAGSSWPIDRSRTAQLLGFDEVVTHSRDAGFGTKDYVAEVLAAIAILMSNISSLSSDLFLWSSYEFGMVELDDAFSGSSSIMAQKKNPWSVDWSRGAAATTLGHFGSSLAALRGASSTDGAAQDFPESGLRDAFATASVYVDLLAGVLDTLEVHATTMQARAGVNWSTASNLADVIVRRAGISFRSAHRIVGAVVREAMAAGTAPSATTAEDLDRTAQAIIGQSLGLSDRDVLDALDPEMFIRSRVTLGSVAPEETTRMIDAERVRLDTSESWIADRRGRLVAAHAELDSIVDARIASLGEA
jgi:argininosuccinate lyase